MMTSIVDLRRVLVDTSAWLALMNRNERFHEAAVAFHRSLDPLALRIITWGILSETYTWLRYHSGYHQAERWLWEEAILEAKGVLEVVFPLEGTDTSIRRLFKQVPRPRPILRRCLLSAYRPVG